ncbi:peptidase inhibitor I78 [Lysobacter terrestris]|uniref:Peptidase inhibitor I78 n=2 Tax=Agrilutibacter terrestris TaxID=2865112 RepID=A0A7H0G1H2_9GAMM|nr:peptidase inhibitor I78 [Lysobacter terrestris]
MAADAQTAATDTTTTGAADTTTTNSTVGGCNADAARSVVGQMASPDVIDQARLAAGAETARTLKPGQAVTMEFNGNRLNLDVDAGNTVTNVRCG